MPIYEYKCTGCSHAFEHLERADSAPRCPECGGGKLERCWSVPAAPVIGKNLAASSESWGGPCGRGGCGRPECG